MTSSIEKHINTRVDQYLSRDNPDPVTFGAIYGPGFDDIPPRKRANLGNRFAHKVRRGEFPGLCEADHDEFGVKRYAKTKT